MAHDVFISHSSKDAQAANAACAVLEARGIRCWIAPRDIAPGTSWAASIAENIGAARVFLLIFSNHANASEQVQREVDVAANHRLTIIPLRIEDTLPEKSLEYFLNTRHWLDAFTPPLEQHLSKLAEAIALILGHQTPLAASDPLPVRRGVFAPREGRTIGPYMLGAAALLSVALIAFGWVAFHREAAPPSPVPSIAAAGPPRPGTVVYPRQQCASSTNGAGFDATFCVTSVLAAQHDDAGKLNAYGPQNLSDNNPATAWCEGVAGPGAGEEITVNFAKPAIVDRITVVNGYAKSQTTFRNNNSVHTLTAIWPDARTTALELADSMAPQSIVTGHDEPVRRLRFRIESVNGGSKWPDSCISELQFALRAP